jgi:hypothetical protein
VDLDGGVQNAILFTQKNNRIRYTGRIAYGGRILRQHDIDWVQAYRK